ncbi:NifU family protein [Thalassospira alkalitolerans]|uniref:Iron transporter n=1 Tax=Thalassospira alkalitolerans TaxID=1293890 RepID=A0A1Y2LFN4_9PROT|nr:NifU family protein [Thalassospira alkalitolerans]OSQ50139.1 iron transporter [Thalassospira alkalitolerans]|tara:strand:+ start:252922 stop:253491 length:570 start_codon:yes stop_codon:yes gene_type:complete
MFIQTEPTPNPATLKFLPGEDVMGRQGTANFTSTDADVKSPLARKLFEIDGITGVFLGGDFITITKDEAKDWQTLKPQILGGIMEHYTSGLPVLEQNSGAATGTSTASEGDNELVSQIKELLDTRVRPAVAQDGGDIVFHKFEDGVVFLEMHGACAGCPSSTATLKMGIENMLRYYVPEVQSVESVMAD